jgi:hypothetical protein
MKRSFTIALGIAISAIFLAGSIIVAADFPAEVKMNAPYDHSKGIITFSHAKHSDDYKIGCGECHHDKDNKPLTLKKGDSAQKCIECHKKPGEIKGKEAQSMSDKEKREYHANALHDNCIDCHKDYNKKNNTKAAPQTCTKCHPKK